MRVGIIAAATGQTTSTPALGERDAMLVTDRLSVDDMGFVVQPIDPTNDLAAQLETVVQESSDQLSELIVYVSALIAHLDDGECYFCLDPENPDVGDAVRDVAELLGHHTHRPVLLVVEGRIEADEPARLRAAATALRECVAPTQTGIELIVSMRPVGAHPERIPSRFTCGLLEEIDATPGALSARQAYARTVEHADLGQWPHAQLYAPGRHSMPLRDPALHPPTAVRSRQSIPPNATARASTPPPAPASTTPAVRSPTPTPAPVSVKPAGPRRPAPPSERADAATVTLSETRRAKPAIDTSLPKVVIAAKADSRRRPTVRRIDSDAITGDSTEAESVSESIDATAGADALVEPTLAPDPSSNHDAAPQLSEAADTETSQSPAPDPEPESSPPLRAPAKPSLRPGGSREGKKLTDWTADDHVRAGDARLGEDDLDGALAEFKKALGKLGTAATPARADVYARIADINRSQGSPRLALSNYEKALAIVPTLERALAGMLDVLVEQRNWRAVQNTEEKLLTGVPKGDSRRLELLIEFGDRAAEHGSPDQARTRYAQARKEFPDDDRPGERLLAMFEQSGAHGDVIAVRRERIASLTDPSERAAALLELAGYCQSTGSHDDEALRLYEQALEADPSQLEALERLAATLADSQEWAELERIYRKTVAAYLHDESEDARLILAELHHKLARLYRDHLDDPEHALASLQDVLELRPDDASAHRAAAALANELDDPATALQHLRRSADLDPGDHGVYRSIFELARAVDDLDTAFLAASVTCALGEATDDETSLHEAHRIEGVPTLAHSLDAAAWDGLRDRHHDRHIDRVMRALAPAVLRVRLAQLEERGKLPKLSERQDPKTSTASVVRSIGWAAEFLGVHPPAIHLDETSEAPLAARFAKHQAMVIGKTAMRGRTLGELAYLAGRHLALRTPEHELVVHTLTIDELSTCFLAGLKLVLGQAPSGPLAPLVDALARALATRITEPELETLTAAVRSLAARRGQLDLGAWAASVERCASRAGLVLCGNLALAIQLIEAEGDTPFSTAEARIAALCAYQVSEAHAKVRAAIGSSLSASAS